MQKYMTLEEEIRDYAETVRQRTERMFANNNRAMRMSALTLFIEKYTDEIIQIIHEHSLEEPSKINQDCLICLLNGGKENG